MKAIIDGIRYDTEKATLLGEASHGHAGDFEHWEAGLYKTPRSGRHFLAGSGGPMSRYSRTIGQNEWTGGRKIDPLTEQQAFEWAQKYLDPEEIEEHFDHLIDDA